MPIRATRPSPQGGSARIVIVVELNSSASPPPRSSRLRALKSLCLCCYLLTSQWVVIEWKSRWLLRAVGEGRGRMLTAKWWCSSTRGVEVKHPLSTLFTALSQSLSFLAGPSFPPVPTYLAIHYLNRYLSQKGKDCTEVCIPYESLPLLIINIIAHMHTDDTVYLSEEAEREEYIMNESGVIWAGAHDNMFNWPWNFAQVCKHLLYTWHTVLHTLHI